jgi:hypothetical protein
VAWYNTGMKRLRRIIFNGLTVLSLLLCMATVVLWVRSHGIADAISREDAAGSMLFGTTRGKCEVVLIGALVGRHGTGLSRWAYSKSPPSEPGLGISSPPEFDYRFARIVYIKGTEQFLSYQMSYRMIIVPLWMLSVASLIIPACWLGVLLHRIRRLQRVGLCPSCGYDLRATPDRCPECGVVPNNSK